MYQRLLIATVALFLFSCSAENPAQNPGGQFFTVQVINEQFVIFVTDQETIRLATENFQGRNTRFPIGRLERGNGGFNQPWNWHLLPDTVRMAESAVEACDGRPSYVEGHIDDYVNAGAYCPWSARIIKIGR
ncbi:hypothetical protein L0222_02795 [bacterium]|nr:hypothetical protein [bacterium]MCI0603945.1 hypothetical protein [bacterium]